MFSPHPPAGFDSPARLDADFGTDALELAAELPLGADEAAYVAVRVHEAWSDNAATMLGI